jgi:hypothetical protein
MKREEAEAAAAIALVEASKPKLDPSCIYLQISGEVEE